MQQVLHHRDETRLYITKEEEIHVGWHLCPFQRTHAHKGILVKTFPNVPYLLHELRVPMWDDISVPFWTRRMRSREIL